MLSLLEDEIFRLELARGYVGIAKLTTCENIEPNYVGPNTCRPLQTLSGLLFSKKLHTSLTCLVIRALLGQIMALVRGSFLMTPSLP